MEPLFHCPTGTCDWGGCDEIATRWRYDPDSESWLPVCDECAGDDWTNPVTGHGADCGCISCHMSQVQ